MAMGDLSRWPDQPDRALRGFFRVHDGSPPRRKSGAEVVIERLPRLTLHIYPCASGPSAAAIGPINRSIEEERRVQVLVRDNNVDQALRVLKKKMQREGVFREMKLRGHY